MRLGAHMSISGGLDKAVARGRDVGCDTIQIFTKNANRWQAKPLTSAEIAAFRRACDAAGIAPVVAHSAYLINLAAPDEELYEKSRQAFLDELRRCALLGIPYLVVHPGAHLGAGEDYGLQRLVMAIDRLHRDAADVQTRITLEVTAGQGSTLGYTFEHFAAVLDRVEEPERLAFCLDTCHLLAAGYDFRTRSGYDRMMEAWDALIGIERIRVLHLNDSKKDLGSRVDRHEHIGRGCIGLEGFAHVLHDRRLSDVPMILETPKDDGADARNLQILRGLMRTPQPPAKE
jgi:deoxyribonuclease-4